MTDFRIRLDRVSKQFTINRERPRSFQELFLFWRRYRKSNTERFWVLRDVSFDLLAGETLGVIGPNGAGKSTILKLIARIVQPTHGRVLVNGQLSALLELGAGFHPDLTGRENVYLSGAIRGFSRRSMRRRMDQIVEFAELESFIDAPTKHYSSGMYMRLAFSVAIHVDPDILLVDEILAVGDSAFQRKCMDRIYELKQAGTTILLISHSLENVTRLCDRAIWLDEGRIRDDGPARPVVENYLVSVNEKDRQRLEKAAAEPSKSPQKRQPERSGSGEIRIVDVTFLDQTGKPQQVFLAGQPVTIRLTYQADQPVENPVFGLGVHRDDDLHVTGPNTHMANYAIPTVQGRGTVDFCIAQLPLMAGRYEISASAYDSTISHKFDYWRRAFSFTVQPRSSWDTLGVIQLPGQWRHRADNDATEH